MLSEKDHLMLEAKSQKELLDVLKLVCRKNDNAVELLHNILHEKKTNSKRTLNKIFRVLEDKNF
ncbi:hypothetical protein MPAN_010400 [Mariniplasma anaerobium]|uniref:Uncharacterized protein n=1 Tax=Mariniplasma anaerobium TaxID=2735436 RepID=A0A7U9TIY2_9MOLU|nr:hypothetical protein MPAN_010400 [Mariniplasma anaerobium]